MNDGNNEQKQTVLVVDDAPENILLITSLLEDLYRVKIANNGKQALRIAFSNEPPDIILLDITMPEMDGIMTLKKLIEIDGKVRVAMVTAMGQQSMVIEALKSGAKDFVVKPFDADRVLAAIKKLTN